MALELNSISIAVNANGEITLGTGSLSITSAQLTATSFSGGSVSINEGGYVDLSSTNPLANAVQINFKSGIGWIKTLNYSPTSVSGSIMGQIKVTGASSVYKTNLRLDNYYQNGCIIRPSLPTLTAPLKI
jgi:hypothetical protein